MRLAGLALLVAGCGRPEGALLEIRATGIPAVPAPACVTTDIRVLIETDTDSAIREASWNGDDPFVFRILAPAFGEATVTVSAVQYTSATESTPLAQAPAVDAPLVDGAAALTIDAEFPDCAPE